MQNSTITCDACSADITSSSGMPDYRLVLYSESTLDKNSGTVCAVYIQNPVPVPLHFCGIHCLTKWANQKLQPAPVPYGASTEEATA